MRRQVLDGPKLAVGHVRRERCGAFSANSRPGSESSIHPCACRFDAGTSWDPWRNADRLWHVEHPLGAV